MENKINRTDRGTEPIDDATYIDKTDWGAEQMDGSKHVDETDGRAKCVDDTERKADRHSALYSAVQNFRITLKTLIFLLWNAV